MFINMQWDGNPLRIGFISLFSLFFPYAAVSVMFAISRYQQESILIISIVESPVRGHFFIKLTT